MWQKIKDSEYFLSFSQDPHYEINVTDFISIWTASYSKADFLSLVKDSNEGLELENNKDYIRDACKMLSVNINKILRSKIEENGNSLQITLRILFEYPFCFQSKFTKGSDKVFFNKVTQPLLKTVKDLRSSQTEMKNLLLKKDKQVKAYERELENKKIIFRHEETKVFNEVEHMEKFKAYEENFGSLDIPNSLIEKSVKIPQALLIKENPTVSVPNIKQEPRTSINITPSSMKMELNHAEQEHNNIKEETDSIRQEPIDIKKEPIHIKEEPIQVKEESIQIKDEPCTPILDEPMTSIVTQNTSCKQEVKSETHSSQMRSKDRRKKIKLNY